jgi:hypothetical protein
MATADIPGVGRVEINGVAEENTMRELLRVMQASSTKSRRFDNELAQSFRTIDKTADDATGSMSAMATSARMASSSSSSLYNELQNQLTKSGSAVGDLGSYAMTFGHDLVSTSTMISKQWASSFNSSTFTDPVAATAGVLNAGLTLAADSTGLISKGFGKLLESFGPVGPMLAAAGEDAGKLAAGVLKTVNEHLAKELTGSIRAMHEFAMMGGSFSGSIEQIRTIATAAHLTLDQFTKVVKTNREQLMGLGQNMELSTARFSHFMGYMDDNVSDYQQTTGINRKYRQELRALGFDTEAQGDVMASYLQVLRSTMTQQEFNNLQARQVAEGTRTYAGNLKILAEFSGKDARALQEKARQESMRGALLAKLDGNQRKAFIDSAAALGVFPDEIKGNIQTALMQQLAGGTITDPVIAGNSRAVEFIRDLAEKVKAGGTDLTDYTIKQAGVLREQTIAYQQATGGVESLNTLFGAGGLVANLGKFNDAIGAMKPIDPKEVEASRLAAERMMNAQGKIVEGYLAANQSAQDFAVSMGALATQALPAYSVLIGDTAKITAQAIAAIIKAAGGGNIETDTDRLIKDTTEAVERLVKNIGNIPKRADGDIVNGTQLSWVGEAGPEAIIPLKNGKTIPVEYAGKTSGFDSSGLVMAARKMQEQQSTKTLEQLPASVATAIENAMSNTSGFVGVMNDLKNQIVTANKEQIDVLQRQVDKLNDLVTATQDNARSNERIAYSMA